MFNGIVETKGEVVQIVSQPEGKRLIIKPHNWGAPPAEGDSIAVNGCCLTHNTRMSVPEGTFGFDVITESLNKTTLGQLQRGSTVNLESALKINSGIHGHLVQGHIDGQGKVTQITTESEWHTITMTTHESLTSAIVPKGSIAIDGVSLTIASVNPQSHSFSVALIPTTLQMTTLLDLKVGSSVNLETDIIAKTVVHWVSLQKTGSAQNGGLTMDQLFKAGFD